MRQENEIKILFNDNILFLEDPLFIYPGEEKRMKYGFTLSKK